jgi:phosphoserine phosphatase
MLDIVATLITRPGDAAGLSAASAKCIAVYGPATTEILSEDEAVDIFFATSDDLQVVRHRLNSVMAGRGIDIVIQPVERRRKKLLVADMDSTMIGQECIDELADFAGLKKEVAAITALAMNGELDFGQSLTQRVALLAGLDKAIIQQVINERISVNPGAQDLVWTMRANGAYTILASGGFIDFADPIGKQIGFDEARANRLISSSGRLTGKVSEPIVGPSAKLEVLEEAVIKLNLPVADVVAVGDGANDLSMIRRAGLGIAYRAKPGLASAADARLEHTSLASILFAQGYRRDQFVR